MKYVVVQRIGDNPCFLSGWLDDEAEALWDYSRANALMLDEATARKAVYQLALWLIPAEIEEVAA